MDRAVMSGDLVQGAAGVQQSLNNDLVVGAEPGPDHAQTVGIELSPTSTRFAATVPCPAETA